jgi:hypothetical protein
MIQNFSSIQYQNCFHKEIEMGMQNAYHLAGYAAAICLGNKHKLLPAVYFRINLQAQENIEFPASRILAVPKVFNAKLEGGRLIQNLPLSFIDTTRDLPWNQQEQYRCAYEADVINLLAGSLAEAKYVALKEQEDFNNNIINLTALQLYSGSSEFEIITEYMECFMPRSVEREQKLMELYSAAYEFVNQNSHWEAISTFANYITDYLIDQSKEVISCEEVMSLLESCQATIKN